MAFEPRMQLGQRLAQMQVMSPQMQQSLALLQAPMLDLRAMINKELQENPVLEELSPDEAAPAENGEATPEANGEIPEIQPPEGTQVDPTAEGNGEPVDDFSKELERLTEMSEEWRDHFTASQVTPIARPSEDDEERRHEQVGRPALPGEACVHASPPWSACLRLWSVRRATTALRSGGLRP